MLDYIDGYNLSEIANFKIDFDRWDINTELFRSNSIIFCKTDFIDSLFNYINISSRKYILITHMSDYPINSGRFFRAPNCIKKWFGQNVTFTNNNLIPLPLGIENHQGGSKGKFTNHQWLEDNIDDLRKEAKKEILYCHWNPQNNLSRDKIVSQLRIKNEVFYQSERLRYEDYCIGISKHKYIICPPGNGVDTHRVWESIYMGCIPIVLRHRIFNSMDLPIIQVNSWEEITPELLSQPISQNTDQAYMAYWKKRITEEFNSL